MKIIALFGLAGLTLLIGHAQEAKPTSNTRESEPVVTHLSVAQVKEIASARVRDTDFPVQASDPWTVVLQIQPKGNVWLAMLTLPNGQMSPFQIYIDDATGRAEYLAPIVKMEQHFAADSDWLFKVDSALKRIKYPIELETLMRAAYFTGAKLYMLGGTREGRVFMDYTLREENEGPARFDVRCYIEEPEGATGPKVVTSAELSYTDAQNYHYRLVRDDP